MIEPLSPLPLPYVAFEYFVVIVAIIGAVWFVLGLISIDSRLVVPQEPSPRNKRYRIIVDTAVGINGAHYTVFIPQRKILWWFWINFKNPKDNTYVAYDSYADARTYLDARH